MYLKILTQSVRIFQLTNIKKRRNWQRAIFAQCTIFAAMMLNFCVRNGNRCVHHAIITRSSLQVSFRTLKTRQQSLSFKLACLFGQALDLLVSVRLTCHHAYTPDLSTLSSLRGLTCLRNGKSHLEVGFTLRCLQRLSLPHLATQLCHWRDNWSTIDASIPVLSY